jgi:hypothetical protein
LSNWCPNPTLSVEQFQIVKSQHVDQPQPSSLNIAGGEVTATSALSTFPYLKSSLRGNTVNQYLCLSPMVFGVFQYTTVQSKNTISDNVQLVPTHSHAILKQKGERKS